MAVEIVAAWIGGGCTIVAAAIAFGTLAFQGRQNRAADLQARRQEFNESLYRDGVRSARALSNAASQFASRLTVVRYQIDLGILSQKFGEPLPPRTRFSDILELSEALTAAFSDLVFLLEERRIADQRLEVFKRAFLAKWYDIRTAFSSELQSELMRCLVLEGPDGSPLSYSPPNEQLVSSLERRLNELATHLEDCGAFCEDLIDALQNIHLSKIYGKKLKHRTPIDPAVIVLDLDNVDRVEAWIAGSAWNLRNEEAEARYRVSLPQNSRDITR